MVSGRGLLHLSVLIETMRREGYELAVGKPEVIIKKINGVEHEPYEYLVVDVPHGQMGPVMELVGAADGRFIQKVRLCPASCSRIPPKSSSDTTYEERALPFASALPAIDKSVRSQRFSA